MSKKAGGISCAITGDVADIEVMPGCTRIPCPFGVVSKLNKLVGVAQFVFDILTLVTEDTALFAGTVFPVFIRNLLNFQAERRGPDGTVVLQARVAFVGYKCVLAGCANAIGQAVGQLAVLRRRTVFERLPAKLLTLPVAVN